MAAVLRSAADAILVLDERGRLQIINPAAQRLFTDIETQLGKPLPRGRGYDDLVHMLDQTRANGAMAHNELPWPDGRTFTIFVTPIEDGGQVSLLHDVTRFKELEKMKNELLATATHDLKNPLTAISGYSDLLLKIGQLTPQQADFIGRIQTAAKQMFELVQDLLEMARLEMGLELKKALLDGRDMLAEICDEFGGQAATKQQTLTFEPIAAPLPINVDAGRLRQVLRNLVGNAVKYTPEGGQITVSARVEARTVRMLVRDTGVGIPPDDLPFIFDKFFRVKSAETRDIEGSGLGLAIVKTIVDQHGGQISVESTPGTGSCFTVSLPLN